MMNSMTTRNAQICSMQYRNQQHRNMATCNQHECVVLHDILHHLMTVACPGFSQEINHRLTIQDDLRTCMLCLRHVATEHLAS